MVSDDRLCVLLGNYEKNLQMAEIGYSISGKKIAIY